MSEKEIDTILSPRAKTIFSELKEHVQSKELSLQVDDYELILASQSFDLYLELAKIVKEEGITTKPAGGGWVQLSAPYTAMNKEYAKFTRLAEKFGLNPKSRERIFSKSMKPKKQKQSILDGLD